MSNEVEINSLTSQDLNSDSHDLKTSSLNKYLFDYALRLGDTTLVLAQRYCEWVGKAPTIEEELALANIGLDTLGQAMAWLEVASLYDDQGRDPDTLAYFRNEREYTNYLIAELENGDFAFTTLRGFFISCYLKHLYTQMQNSTIKTFQDIAIKSSKEVAYHVTHQSTWLIRLGNGTEESHDRLQRALDDSWSYTEELFDVDELLAKITNLGVLSDMEAIRFQWRSQTKKLIEEANLTLPQEKYHHRGGNKGLHTEALGLMLAEMQAMRREFPNVKW